MNQFKQTMKKLCAAGSPEALFGETVTMTLPRLRSEYHRLAAQVHPDHNPAEKEAATSAFQRLNTLYALAKEKLKGGVYGRPQVIEIATERYHYVGHSEPITGDIAALYPAEERRNGTDVYLKVVHHPQDNDLLEAEQRHLNRLARELALNRLRPHFPTLLESVRMRTAGRAEHRVNVLVAEADTVSLQEIIAAHPGGIDPADAAWIFNRLLAALGTVHDLGLVHGAVLPPHFLVREHDHNGMLIDWCYAVEVGKPVPAIVPTYEPFYPPELLQKRGVTPATDLFMAAMTMSALLGGDLLYGTLPARVPPAIQALLRTCLIPNPQRRPQDAWELFDAFQEILIELYGPPTFRAVKFL